MIKKKSNIDGILLLDKPQGISSNKALQKVKKIFNAKKAGHTGTLDPMATGLLPICFGNATKTARYLINSSKTYNVIAEFGIKTTTGDSEGEILERNSNLKIYEIKEVKKILDTFVGKLSQIPPMYSALKVNGTPLYKYARKGETIKRRARIVNIHSILINSYDNKQIDLNISCSKGTYIRTLIEDIAVKLGTVAYVKKLRRISLDVFKDKDMISLEQLLNTKRNELENILKPIDYGLMHLPFITIDSEDLKRFANGQSFESKNNIKETNLAIRIYNNERILIGLANQKIKGEIQPVNVFTNN